jgi:hypothetical protein
MILKQDMIGKQDTIGKGQPKMEVQEQSARMLADRI